MTTHRSRTTLLAGARGLSRRRLMAAGVAVAALLLAAPDRCPPPSPTVHQLAVADGGRLLVFDTAEGTLLHEIDRFQEVEDLAFSPDGEHLAASVCAGDRIVELDAESYAANQDRVRMTADSCPGDLRYSPDGGSLVASLPVRRGSVLGPMDYHLKSVGAETWELDTGPLAGAVAYRPGGAGLAVGAAGAQALWVLDPEADHGPGVVPIATVSDRQENGLIVTTLAYTTDGARLLIGTPDGLRIRNAADGYAVIGNADSGSVYDLAVDATGHWTAVVRGSSVDVFRAPELLLARRQAAAACHPCPAKTLASGSGFRRADFSPDGTLLAVTEPAAGKVRLFRAPDWRELPAIENLDRASAIAFRPSGATRTPVVFVHGHSRDSRAAWFDSSRWTTSFAAALAANPDRAIDAFYLELPVHGDDHPENRNRSIAVDAVDIRAAIEGGTDSRGGAQVGILNMPQYQGGKVAIVGLSQGTVSSRIYLRQGPSKVSTFVALAAPQHGLGGSFSCGELLGDQLDRARRELCGGLTAKPASQRRPCGGCGGHEPKPFAVYGYTQARLDGLNLTVDQAAETGLLEALNGHGFARNCGASLTQAEEAFPGVLHVNLYADDNADELVGGAIQKGDCVGRRLARSHGPGVVNRSIADVPARPPEGVHGNFAHHWPAICVALRSVSEGTVPAAAEACDGLVEP